MQKIPKGITFLLTSEFLWSEMMKFVENALPQRPSGCIGIQIDDNRMDMKAGRKNDIWIGF